MAEECEVMVVKSTEPVRRLVDRAPVFIAPTATLREIAERLWWQAVGALVVGTADEPLGIVSERDIVALIATGAEPTTTAREAMTATLVTVRENDSVHDAVAAMLDHAVRHVPVTNDDGRVIGVVSIRDLGRLLVGERCG